MSLQKPLIFKDVYSNKHKSLKDKCTTKKTEHNQDELNNRLKVYSVYNKDEVEIYLELLEQLDEDISNEITSVQKFSFLIIHNNVVFLQSMVRSVDSLTVLKGLLKCGIEVGLHYITRVYGKKMDPPYLHFTSYGIKLLELCTPSKTDEKILETNKIIVTASLVLCNLYLTEEKFEKLHVNPCVWSFLIDCMHVDNALLSKSDKLSLITLIDKNPLINLSSKLFNDLPQTFLLLFEKCNFNYKITSTKWLELAKPFSIIFDRCSFDFFAEMEHSFVLRWLKCSLYILQMSLYELCVKVKHQNVFLVCDDVSSVVKIIRSILVEAQFYDEICQFSVMKELYLSLPNIIDSFLQIVEGFKDEWRMWKRKDTIKVTHRLGEDINIALHKAKPLMDEFVLLENTFFVFFDAQYSKGTDFNTCIEKIGFQNYKDVYIKSEWLGLNFNIARK